MRFNMNKIGGFALGVAYAVLVSSPAFADDTELFVGSANAAIPGRPNILLILDDSNSMTAELHTLVPYDPATDFTNGSSCRRDRIYWSEVETPPPCDTDAYLLGSGLKCQHALDAFASPNGGTYRDELASYDDTAQSRWESLDLDEGLDDHDRSVECAADWGQHGESGSDRPYPRNGDPSELWTAGTNQLVEWGAFPTEKEFWLFDGNYLAWLYGAPTVTSTRMDIAKQVASNLVGTVSGVNVGLMHFTQRPGSLDGGRVAFPVSDVASGTVRADLQTRIAGLSATKSTPLSETLYEAALYLMGRAVDYGLQSPVSVPESRVGDTYASPVALQCQKSHVIYITDGEPRDDDDANSKILALNDAAGRSIQSLVPSTAGGQCDVETYPAPWQPEGGQCFDDLAEFLQKADLSPLEGQQNAVLHTVGFALGGNDLPVLREAAERGGGNYYDARDATTLASALSDIVTNILDSQSTFTAPTVSVNSFNRARTLNDLFISLFEPTGTTHWPGNLKKYELSSDGEIIDARGQPAVNPATGFFFNNARNFWLDAAAPADGADVKAGGAANRIPAERFVYSNLVPAVVLTDSRNRIAAGNGALTDARMHTGNGRPTLEQVVAFINGVDAADHDQDASFSEARNQMGDPLHSEAVTVTYGPSDTTVYFATNDGFLHAIDADTGVEKWAFIPEEFLADQVELFLDEAVDSKNYGIDGNLRIQQIGDSDGVVEKTDGERVYLFFGMRRGGDAYYALDVTTPTAPELLWRHDSTTLPGAGQSWTSATPTRINVDSPNQSASKLVVVLGGGYDASQDGAAAAIDDAGNSIYIVDSENGSLLWHGTHTGGDKSFSVDGKSMSYSIPADVKVLDFDGDGFADRMYAADMGGQIWRFDVRNGETPANLIVGGVIAQLGAAPNEDPDLSSVRRFYYAPDVALASLPNRSFIHIGIGSGHRGHPLGKDAHDRFYALRDMDALRPLTDQQYRDYTPITDADLEPVTSVNTTVSSTQKGWKLELNTAAGEKVLAEARTFNNQVFFTTFTPDGGTANQCEPRAGTNRIYVMNVVNAAPVMNLDRPTEPGPLTLSDISRTVNGSILSQVVFLFPSPTGDPSQVCTGDDCNTQAIACVDLFCMPTGFGNNPIRTVWRQENIE